MPAPWSTDTPGVIAEGLTGTAATVRVLSLSPGLGDDPDQCQLHLTNLTYDQVTHLNGKKVIVYRGNPAQYVFVGWIRRTSRRGPAGASEAYCWATDCRGDLDAIIIGQSDMGEMPGGFFGVGSNVVFNPDNLPNRQLLPRVKNVQGGIFFDNVFRFAEPGLGEYWTIRDALLTLINWFVEPGMFTVDTTQFDAHAALIDVHLSGLSVEFMPVSHAITAILKQMGFTWTLRFDRRDSNLCPTDAVVPQLVIMGQDIAAPVTYGAWLSGPPSGQSQLFPQQLPIPVVDTVDTVLVNDWQMDESIDQSVARTEVVGEEDVVEILWEYRNGDEEHGTMSEMDVPSTMQKEFAYAIQQAPAYFANNDALLYYGAAGNWTGMLPAGATALQQQEANATVNTVRVPWLRKLRSPAGDDAATYWDDSSQGEAADCLYIFTQASYDTAAAAALASGYADLDTAMKNDVTGTKPRRLKGGFKIDPKHGVIYFAKTVKYWADGDDVGFGDPGEEIELDAIPYRVYFSCACKVPRRTTVTAFNEAPHPYTRTRVVRPRQLKAYMRHSAMFAEGGDELNPPYYNGVPAAWENSVTGTGYTERLASGVGEPVTRIIDPTAELTTRLTVIHSAAGVRRFRGNIVFSRAPWINLGDRIQWPYLNPGFPQYTRVFAVQTDFTKMQTTIEVDETFL